jgi:hypothetical protein
MGGRGVVSGLMVSLVLLGGGTAVQAQDLARAHVLYNEGRYTEAIEAATQAQTLPATRPAAGVVLARAHLERYRDAGDPTDLVAARAALSTVQTAGVPVRVRIDYLFGLGQALFFDNSLGAAAELFASATAAAWAVDASAGEAMTDWWGSAVERELDGQPSEVRRGRFQQLADDMRQELARHPTAAAPAYWVAVALRGAGDPERAWDAAVAAWVRAPLTGDSAATLRADLDRLVLDAIIPDLAAARPAGEQTAAASQWRAEWTLVRQRWR